MAGRAVDPYGVLGVARTATRAEIGRAYRRLAKVRHPDHQAGDPTGMSELNRAWSILSDAARRAAWDAAHPVPGESHWQRPAPRPDVAAASVPAWAGGWKGEPPEEVSGARIAAIGCLPLLVLTVVLALAVMLAALSSPGSGLPRDGEAQTTQAPR